MIEELGKSLRQKVNIGIRLNPDIDGKTLDKISTGSKTDKFGIPFDTIPDVCSKIKKLDWVNL